VFGGLRVHKIVIGSSLVADLDLIHAQLGGGCSSSNVLFGQYNTRGNHGMYACSFETLLIFRI
jgi:hypothetical protein